jgi:superfamily II RNA helicase
LLCERYGVLEEPSAKRLRSVIRHGVAYHHAGMLPTLKEIVEQLFTAKLLPLIFTTETFALGINMPARTVVFDSLRKYYAGGFGPLRPRDFHQMAGRAGRRGMDTEGFVYVRLVPTQATLAEVQYSLFGQPDPVISQFNASYATTLNLYAHYGDKVLDMYPRTFHCFQASKRQRQRARQRFKDRLDALKAIGCIRRDALTSRGQFARWMFGYELYLSHLFEEGLLDRFSPHELCFALSCMVFEPRPGTHVPKIIPRQWAWVAREMHRAYVAIHHVEVRYDIEPAATPPRPHLGGAIEAWVKGDDFTATVELSGIDEGELVRYLRMIVQLLRQLQHAPYTSEKLRAIARTARALIDRGVVDAERQLRA